MLRWILTHAFHPCSLFSWVRASIRLIQSGVPLMAVVSGVSIFFILVCFALELKFAENPSWHFDSQELRSDVLYAMLSNTVPTEAFRLLNYGAIVAASGALEGIVGFEFWPDAWPLPGQFGVPRSRDGPAFLLHYRASRTFL